MNKKHLNLYILLSFILVPLGASAQVTNFAELVTLFGSYLRLLVPFLIGLGVVVFFWGVVRYVTAGEDQQRLRDGARLMSYGIIAIFVMVAVWGLVWIIINTFGIEGLITTPPNIPVYPGSG